MDPGRAYAFFDCAYPLADIQADLPRIRDELQTPSELELLLSEGTTHLQPRENEQSFNDMLEAMRKENLRYTMEATYPEHSDYDAAVELHHIMNYMYTDSHLFEPEERFFGHIAYKELDYYTTLE